ncbi:hypothetical protein CAPTEDRAFT_186478, partial [Capitella teleta]
MIAADNGCSKQAWLIREALMDDGVEIAEFQRLPEYVNNKRVLAESLEKLRARGRILLFCFQTPDDTFDFLLEALMKGMLTKEFAFVTYWYHPDMTRRTPWDYTTRTFSKEEIELFKKAYASVKFVSPETFDDESDRKFQKQVMQQNLQPPSRSVNLYDGTYLYLNRVHEAHTRGIDFRNGSLIFNLSRGAKFKGVMGEVVMDEEADRDPVYVMWDYRPGWSAMRSYATVRQVLSEAPHELGLITCNLMKVVNFTRETYWTEENNTVPPMDTPSCSLGQCFQDRRHDHFVRITIGISLPCLAVLVLAWTICIKRAQHNLLKSNWKIPADDLIHSPHVKST